MSEPVALRAIRAGLQGLGAVSPGAAARVALRLFVRPRRYGRPERERKVLATGTRLALKCGYQATEWGAGPTVLLVHGWEGRGTQLGAFVQPLVAAGRRVVALDGPAHGDSPGRETNGVDFARALVAVERELGGVEAVVAHSFGSAAAILAMDMGMPVPRLAVIAGPARTWDVLWRFTQFLRMRGAVAERFMAECEKLVGRRVEDLHQVDVVARLNPPGLIVHDRDDAEVPYADGVALANAWPAAELRTMTGLGHRRILRDPEVVRQVVRFVTAEADVPAEALTRLA
jgi:pimeloyl-ACP methyl ester carboxylesterase